MRYSSESEDRNKYMSKRPSNSYQSGGSAPKRSAPSGGASSGSHQPLMSSGATRGGYSGGSRGGSRPSGGQQESAGQQNQWNSNKSSECQLFSLLIILLSVC